MILPHLPSIQVKKTGQVYEDELILKCDFGAQVRINDIQLRSYEDPEFFMPEYFVSVTHT